MKQFFNVLKQNWVKVGLGIGILAVLFFTKEMGNSSSNTALISATATPEPIKPGAWVDNLDSLEKVDLDDNGECLKATREQIGYLKNETLSEKFKFDNYKIPNLLQTKPADLDINSNKHARFFRTGIGGELQQGINFAGRYTIVDVGMTGWGSNYWIVDRVDGKATDFPYWASSLDFKKDSNLIIMNPKTNLFGSMKEMSDYFANCSHIGGDQFMNLRPFYFIWENNELKLLGPTDIKPPINKFWKRYFD